MSRTARRATSRSVLPSRRPCRALPLLAALLVAGACAVSPSVLAAAEKPVLKVAMLIPIEPWDRKAGLEAWRDQLEEQYRVQVTWLEPAAPLPGSDATDAQKKEFYENPPGVPGLEKARDADVVFTALTHTWLDAKQSVEFLELLSTKPVVGGRRSHHGLYLKIPKGTTVPGVPEPGKYGEAVFGGGYAGHHGGKQRFRPGQADHPIVRDLPELVSFSLYDRGYKHRIVADDVTVLIEMEESGEPQTWCRTHKETGRRSVYTVHDPADIQKHAAVRTMLTRALFWAAGKNEADYRK
jgi:hypothetical protein